LSTTKNTAVMLWGSIGGVKQYRFGAGGNITGFNSEDSAGKLRIERFNTSGTPAFNFSFFNTTSNEWVTTLANQKFNDSARTQFVHLYVISTASALGGMNVTLDDFENSGENFTFDIFNVTEEEGQYNVTIFVNDSAGNINNTENTTFHIVRVNTAPSKPIVLAPLQSDIKIIQKVNTSIWSRYVSSNCINWIYICEIQSYSYIRNI